jgi:predicted  nucleic acid-binding Zn-ribbon protein
MSVALELLRLHDVDLMLREADADGGTERLARIGLALDRVPLERARRKALERVDKRWLGHYERAFKRYGRGLALVWDRVCQGCYVTLPTSASPSPDENLTLCQSCGRILYWR